MHFVSQYLLLDEPYRADTGYKISNLALGFCIARSAVILSMIMVWKDSVGQPESPKSLVSIGTLGILAILPVSNNR